MQHMLSASCRTPAHVSDTYVETQLRNPSNFDAGTCGGNQLDMPCSVATDLLQPSMACTGLQTVANISTEMIGTYCPGAFLVQSATLLDHEYGSKCSTADTVGTSNPMQELPNSESAQFPTDSISATMFPQTHITFATASEPYLFTPSQFPTIGSIGHFTGHCKPCAFVCTKGCTSGYECKFCHLCAPGEKKRRKRAKVYYNHLKRDWLLWATIHKETSA